MLGSLARGMRQVLSTLGLGQGPCQRHVQAGAGRERVPVRAGSQLMWQDSLRAFVSSGHHSVDGRG